MYLGERYAQDIAQAAENVKDHQVQLIMKNGANELWRCTRGNSSCYGFDLAVSRFGMAVYGDCDSLVFKVGASYGTEFLARKCLDGYYISKLEPEFREQTSLDEDALRALLLSRGIALWDSFGKPDSAFLEPDYFEPVRDGAIKPEQLGMFINWLRELRDNDADAIQLNAGYFESWIDKVEELLEEHTHDDVKSTEAFLHLNQSDLYLDSEWYETRIRAYSGRLIQRLEMLRLCAVKIEQFKKDNPRDGNESW